MARTMVHDTEFMRTDLLLSFYNNATAVQYIFVRLSIFSQ